MAVINLDYISTQLLGSCPTTFLLGRGRGRGSLGGCCCLCSSNVNCRTLNIIDGFLRLHLIQTPPEAFLNLLHTLTLFPGLKYD